MSWFRSRSRFICSFSPQYSDPHLLFQQTPLCWGLEKCTFTDTSYILPGGPNGKGFACNAGDLGSTPESEQSPGEGYGNPLQHSCLESPMDRGAWWATVHGVAESDTPEQLIFSLHFPVYPLVSISCLLTQLQTIKYK